MEIVEYWLLGEGMMYGTEMPSDPIRPGRATQWNVLCPDKKFYQLAGAGNIHLHHQHLQGGQYQVQPHDLAPGRHLYLGGILAGGGLGNIKIGIWNLFSKENLSENDFCRIERLPVWDCLWLCGKLNSITGNI